MSGSSYRVAPIFLIRMAGVPFDAVEKLATVETAKAARELLVRQTDFAEAKAEVEELLRHRGHGLSEELFRAWRKAIRSGTMPPPADQSSRAFANCWECASEVAKAEAVLEETLQRELRAAREALSESSRRVLPLYLVFGGGGVRELLVKLLGKGIGEWTQQASRNARAGDRERHMLLYLQRVGAKNDTFSAFGPSAWGTIDDAIDALRMRPAPGIAKRETFLERWTAHGVAAAMNADPEIREELSPRLHPNGRIEGNQFFFTDTGETTLLDSETIALLNRCDGRTPSHSLGIDIENLTELAERKMIRWEVEVPAVHPHALDVLVSDVSLWREGPARTRWLDLLQPIAALPRKFAETEETDSRIEIIDETSQRLEQLGLARKTADRFLYSAGNSIGEECFREGGFSIGDKLINEVATDAAPWIDLWRDNYAFVASRVATGLRALLEKTPMKDGALPLPAFIRHCEQMKMPLTGPAMVGLAHLAFQEVKAAFREQLRNRPEADEWELTEEDCHFIRRNFDYPKFDEYTYPSADVQISARSAEAVGRGEHQWVLAELHPPIALLHHCFYWSCPDRAELSRALASTTCGRPAFHYGFFAADFSAHTTVRWIDALPELMNFIAPHRGDPRWRVIPPAETEVYIEEGSGDVCLRLRGSHEHLGSFARSWVIPLGFHPFLFGRSPHMPRLRCGKVIVQRRSWTVNLEELPAGNYTGVSRSLILAIESLRAAKGWPRHIYIRPSEQALRRSGAESRDKDTKPVYIDLESYLFLEIFHRWLTKSGELEVTEMLPTPDDLLWQEADGRRTFELRTQIVPNA